MTDYVRDADQIARWAIKQSYRIHNPSPEQRIAAAIGESSGISATGPRSATPVSVIGGTLWTARLDFRRAWRKGEGLLILLVRAQQGRTGPKRLGDGTSEGMDAKFAVDPL